MADIDSEGNVPLADTSHKVEEWSHKHWEAEMTVSDSLNQGFDDQPRDPAQLFRQFHPHTAHKVLAGFKHAFSR